MQQWQELQICLYQDKKLKSDQILQPVFGKHNLSIFMNLIVISFWKPQLYTSICDLKADTKR